MKRIGWSLRCFPSLKTTKRRGTEKVCPQKECGFAEPYFVTDDDPGAAKQAGGAE